MLAYKVVRVVLVKAFAYGNISTSNVYMYFLIFTTAA